MRFVVGILLAASLPIAAQTELNDVHSRSNPTRVAAVEEPGNVEALAAAVRRAADAGLAVSISGGRHSMGGQQFAEGSLHISMGKMSDVLSLDRERGVVRVEAGIQWPEFIDYLVRSQAGDARPWGISQKQTGADRLSLGGSLSSNIHGRGLTTPPIVHDVVAFSLVRADGSVEEVTRESHPELFSLVIGGYGLFGVIATIDLQLVRRIPLQRLVEEVGIADLSNRFAERIGDGFLFGDYQFKTDEKAPDFLKIGIFSCYGPAPAGSVPSAKQKSLTPDDWQKLLALAHEDKAEVWKRYRDYYMSSNGQLYWSDTHQLSYYNPDYESYLASHLSNYVPGSLMITEAYVPLAKLTEFMETCASDFREHDVNLIYGTIRLIRRDSESFLAWARQDYACIIFNLRIPQGEEALEKAKSDFRRIIDRALALGGSYYLTYHRWARRDQVLAAYPQFPKFLELKLKYDPEERFQSEWYRHYRAMFSK